MFLFVIEIDINILILILLVIFFFIFLLVLRRINTLDKNSLDKYIDVKEKKTPYKREIIEYSKRQNDLSKEINFAQKEDDLKIPDNKPRAKGIYIDFRKKRK